jgi:hypothetical protein
MPKEPAAPSVAEADERAVAVAKPDEEKLGTPEEHAVAEKQFVGTFDRYARIGDEAATVTRYTWQHNCAAALHGWADHEHHAGAPIRITAKAYRNALRAAAGPDATGDYVAHQAALSPHCPHTKKA